LFEYLEKRKKWLVYAPLILYWFILFIATSLPSDRLPSIGFSDKIDHFIAYFILAVLLNLTLIFQRKSRLLFEKAMISTIIICLFYGIADELHQILIPGRFAETLDWAADASGTIVGVLIVNFLITKLKYQLKFN
jgi:VanZ family protein